MNGPKHLLENVGRLKTRMGAAFVGSRAVFRGHDLHTDLAGIDWVELYVFGITGRRYTGNQLRLLHALWSHTSYPDARIWNNRVAALAGSARSTGNLAIAGALALSDASIYGRGIDIRAIDFLIRTRKHLENGGELAPWIAEELHTRRSIAGYGRPIAAGDERIAPTMALAESLGLAGGKYVSLAFTVEKMLLAGRWRLQLNYGGLAAALVADMNMSPEEHYLYSFPAFLAGMPPCYSEARQCPEGSLFPLACEHVRYEGQAKRPWQTRR